MRPVGQPARDFHALVEFSSPYATCTGVPNVALWEMDRDDGAPPQHTRTMAS